MKENGDAEFPKRENFIKAWEQDHQKNLEKYELSIQATMEEKIVELIPCDEATGVCEDNASVEMIKNQTKDSPSWYPTYDDLYNDAKKEVDDNIEDLLEEERVNSVIEQELRKLMDQRADQLVVDETAHLENPTTLEQARQHRLEQEKEAARQPISPDFTVFKNGYGQTSPLLTIKTTCDEMGYGVKFNQGRGTCDFTRDYCKRYGLTFFYNKKLGENDCKLAGAQRVSETIFGTTVTRSVKRLFGQSPIILGSTGNTIYESGFTISPYDSTVALDKMELGAPYSIWN